MAFSFLKFLSLITSSNLSRRNNGGISVIYLQVLWGQKLDFLEGLN